MIDLELEDILRRFNKPVKPTPDQLVKMDDIQDKFLLCALYVHECCPKSKEKSIALTLLQQAKQMANEAICRTPEVKL